MFETLSFSSLPPGFWFVFWHSTILFGGLIGAYHGFIMPLIKRRRRRKLKQLHAAQRTIRTKRQEKDALHERIDQAYFALRMVCEPGIMNPDHPGNPIFMKSEARDQINSPLRARLQQAGWAPPALCTTEDASLQEWFGYLGRIRADQTWLE